MGAADAERDRVERATTGEGLQLVAKLAEGAGTRTWLAREKTSREQFTVTFAVSEDPARRHAVEARFAAVAEAWSVGEHPGLVGVRATVDDAGQPCALVAAHVNARPLAEHMRADGRVAPEALLPVLADAARGLSQLHDRGWVHGALAAHHVLVTPKGRGLIDGYGVPAGTPGGPAAWGQGDRSGLPDAVVDGAHGSGRRFGHETDGHGDGPADGADTGTTPAVAAGAVTSPAEDVRALSVTGWLALTGRYPGPDSHRVPLALMCPAAPRHLVLLLEAALCDDPAERPSALELATGFDTPVRRPAPARRPAERMTPEVIRADGTVVRSRRRLAFGGGRSRGTGSAATAALVDSPRRGRVLLVVAAALCLAALAWGGVSWAGQGSTTATNDDAAASAAPGAVSEPTGSARTGNGTAGTGEQAGSAAGAGATGASDGASPSSSRAGAAGGEGAGASAAAPGESMQEKDRAARDAVADLVARRARALAAGDEAAVEAVYVPQSGLAARDRDLIRRAAAQSGSGSGPTALTGMSMEVASLEEQEPDPGAHLTPTEAARSKTYDADVVTRGWNGPLPTGAAVANDGDQVRQHLRLTIVRTSQGWRLADVTPVAPDSH
ncbi:protein kinase [Kocuria varians]|uniref:protein kinase n=1 Tax=Kocuria varians TaxID=1272 RepID=UPI0008399CF2|nr:protein kinase [Kocuria varians]